MSIMKNTTDQKKKVILEYTADMMLIIVLSFIYYLNMIVKTNEVIYIPKGSINGIISHLQQNKYQVSKLDSIILRFLGSPQSGWIYIGEKKLTRGDFLYKLTTAKAAMKDITLIPGETSYIFLNDMAEIFALDRVKLQYFYERYSSYPEGNFVPNTYKLPLGSSEEMIIKILLGNSQKKMIQFSKKIFGTYNEKKWLKYLIVASIVQKEAASVQEMPLVASVIYNRLKKGMKLQMDGALNYGKYSHVKITAKRLKEDTTHYNTYLFKGLPPYPVCNVSFDAIKAAIFPAKSSYLYFVKIDDSKHIFTSNYRMHQRYIRKLKRKNKKRK